MLSNQKMIHIELICCATIGGMMASMSNPRYRGENFTWESFPDMAKEHCRIQVLCSDILSNRNRVEGLQYAESFGKSKAESWVRQMTE